MGVGLVRSLQPPDILWIHWRVYNSIANTSKGVLFCPFWCLCQKLFLSPLYFNKTLLHKSSEQSSLVSGPGLNSSPPEAKNPTSYRSATTFQGYQQIWQSKLTEHSPLVYFLIKLYSVPQVYLYTALKQLWKRFLWTLELGSDGKKKYFPQWKLDSFSLKLARKTHWLIFLFITKKKKKSFGHDFEFSEIKRMLQIRWEVIWQ